MCCGHNYQLYISIWSLGWNNWVPDVFVKIGISELHHVWYRCQKEVVFFWQRKKWNTRCTVNERGGKNGEEKEMKNEEGWWKWKVFWRERRRHNWLEGGKSELGGGEECREEQIWLEEKDDVWANATEADRWPGLINSQKMQAGRCGEKTTARGNTCSRFPLFTIIRQIFFYFDWKRPQLQRKYRNGERGKT